MFLNIVTSLLRKLSALARWQKRLIVFFIDLALLIQSVWIAYSLRIGEWIYWNDVVQIFGAAAMVLAIACFGLTGVYNTIFRYAGIGAMQVLLRAFATYTAILIVVFMFFGINGVPRTMAIIQPVVFFLMVVAFRLAIRFLVMEALGKQRRIGDIRRVLIYGAGDAGQQLASSLMSDAEAKLLGYIDDDIRLRGQKLDGKKIFWSGDLDWAISNLKPTDVFLALPNTARKRRHKILENLERFHVAVKTLPQMRQIVDGKISVSDIRPVEIDDLLGRESVAPNELLLGRTIVGKTVLVTGAGGSIGSELCRQIIAIGAQRLIMFEISEFALYKIDAELRSFLAEKDSAIELVCALGSVTDRRRVKEIFAQYTVDTVYHAAAYKHVPLVEENPRQGVVNNVFGTLVAVSEAHIAGVNDFTLISTDKAVRPTNVMGATKRAAEQVLQAFSEQQRDMRCSMVRFGNVLGSSGSVVPLFQRQIEQGGPITLTNWNITRYFMTIPEAANLVIQACGLATGGEVFLLDMGKPIKIYDLAATMIRLSGLAVSKEPNDGGDIEIKEIGLRPGEKLYEELLIGDAALPTTHPQIFKAHESHASWVEIQKPLNRLTQSSNDQETIAILAQMVPEFNTKTSLRAVG